MFSPQYKTGLVLGKFMPLHKGHEYLIRFAQQYCHELVVVVDCLKGQTLSPAIRKAWIEDAFPHVRVVALSTPTPQQPEDTSMFWDIWRETLIQAIGQQPDVLVAAMDYGQPLSEALGCAFVPIDIARESIPISATQIRENPLAHWDYLAQSARPYFAKKVCLMGPESTGKSTSAALAAKHLNTTYVPEYAKALIERQSGDFFEHNVLEVACAQRRSEAALMPTANRILICDTNVLTTVIWSDLLFGKHPGALDEVLLAEDHDLTLVMRPDVPWVADVHRQVLPDCAEQQVRDRFFETCLTWLERLGRAYQVVEGPLAERPRLVVTHCERLLQC